MSTLHLHQHTQDHIVTNTSHCTDDGKHQHASEEENCILCFNIHTPFAIDYIPFVDYAVMVFEFITLYHACYAVDGYDTDVQTSSNKDPPFSLYS